MTDALPYGPVLTRLLRPLQRALNVVNRASVAPLLRWRLGWLLGTPLTGSLMLLRTRGRRSGLVREAPLGYAIREGGVYCVAGYGETTPWFLNLVADPEVEVMLPARRFRGRAVAVNDPTEWSAAFRLLIGSFALVGRAIVGDVTGLPDAELHERFHALPIVRIEAVDGHRIEPGPFDPDGRGWLLVYVVAPVVAVGAWAVGRRNRKAAQNPRDTADRRPVQRRDRQPDDGPRRPDAHDGLVDADRRARCGTGGDPGHPSAQGA